MKNRIVYLDVLRIIACFGVIANHTNFILNKGTDNLAVLAGATLYMVLCKMAVTLFIMISGSLLLAKTDDYKKHLARILRIVTVLVVFSAIYYFTGDYEHSLKDFFNVLTKNNVTTAFWYLYLYIGILIMLPVLQKMVRNFEKKDYIYFLFFSLVVCSFSFVTEYNSNFSLPVFATFVGIFVFGYYLDKFVTFERFHSAKFIVAMMMVMVIITGFLFVYTLKGVVALDESAYRLMVYDNIFYIALSGAVFLLVKYFCGKCTSKVLSYIGSCTFGIYLLSDLIIKMLEGVFTNVNTAGILSLVVMFFYGVAVFVIGLIITAVLKKIPLVKKIL